MEIDLLCLGEALIDIVHQDGHTAEHVGGSPLNVACGLAALGHSTGLGAWWGQDDRGRRIAAHLAERGVQTVPGSDRAERTTIADATVDADGKATYTFDLLWELPALEELTGVGHVHTGSIAATLEPGGSQVVEAFTRARESGATTSYDPNARPAIMGEPSVVLRRVEELVALSDVVKVSDEDLAWLCPQETVDEVVERWIGLGPGLVVVTRGGDGSLARLAGQDGLVAVEPRQVEVVDTVGAGDSFMAGLLSGLWDAGFLGSREGAARLHGAGWDEIRAALGRAVATSGVTVTHAGPWSPTREDLG